MFHAASFAVSFSKSKKGGIFISRSPFAGTIAIVERLRIEFAADTVDAPMPEQIDRYGIISRHYATITAHPSARVAVATRASDQSFKR